MKHDIKLIALDLDGTTLDNSSHLSERTVRILNQVLAKGINLVFASGRCLSSIESVFIGTDLDTTSSNFYLCGLNGAQLMHYQTRNIYYTRNIDSNAFMQLFQEVEAINHQAIFIAFGYLQQDVSHLNLLLNEYSQTNDFTNNFIHQCERICSVVNDAKLSVIDATQGSNFEVQKIYLSMPSDQLRSLHDRWQNQLTWSYEINSLVPGYYQSEITALGVDKSLGIRYLCDRLGIDPEFVMAAGNESNDIPMFKFVKHGVAVGNAPQHIQKHARHVTASNVDDGVAKIIEEMLGLS